MDELRHVFGIKVKKEDLYFILILVDVSGLHLYFNCGIIEQFMLVDEFLIFLSFPRQMKI